MAAMRWHKLCKLCLFYAECHQGMTTLVVIDTDTIVQAQGVLRFPRATTTSNINYRCCLLPLLLLLLLDTGSDLC